jgi:hypothetical protein
VTARLALAVVAGTGILLPSARASALPTKEACVAANEEAQALRRRGRLLAARADLELCVNEGCPGPVREDCVERLADVNAAIPSVVLEVKDASGNDLSAVHVAIDGRAFADRIDGRALELDPGEHNFVFEAPGHAVAEKRAVILERDRARRLAVVLDPLEVPRPNPPDRQPDPARPSPMGFTQRRVGLVVGGTGLAGLLAGAVLGIRAKATYDDALAHCPGGHAPCDPVGVRMGKTANTEAAAATAAFIAGGALAAGGVAIYLTTPKGRLTFGVGVVPVGISARATW